tara:strand:+ start:308 stop:1051 length:744 start_codon:yes stop_codon:yes gene_type:complete
LKFNYQIIIEYLGVDLVGWQFQKNGQSIQEITEKTLSKVLHKKIRLIGSGRTDAGVNARGQSANFFLDFEIRNKFKTLESLNFILRKFNISILSIKKKNLDFHARYSAKSRLYEYVILNRQGNAVIEKDRSWLIKKPLDFVKMKKAISYFLGTHNFTAFRASSCTAKSPIKKISRANIKKNQDKIIINIESKSFLQKQVRSMVGCLKYVGENKWEPEKIKKLLKSKSRIQCAPPAPPHGLYLKKVIY